MDDLNRTEAQTGKGEKRSPLLTAFVPAEAYRVTPMLVTLNSIVFVLMIILGIDAVSPEPNELVNWGANFRPKTLSGEYWRLLTYVFLHVGVVHVTVNMIAMLTLGKILEAHYGSARFFLAFLFCTTVSALCSFYWNDKTISAGSSGFLFGAVGMMGVMWMNKQIRKEDLKLLLAGSGIFLLYHLIHIFRGETDLAAHGGGLCAGLIFALILLPVQRKSSAALSSAAHLFFMIIPVVLFFLIKSTFPAGMPDYYKRINEFNALEAEALKVYSLPQESSKSLYIEQLQLGLLKWEEAQKLLGELKPLEIPLKYKEKNLLLQKYVDQRIACFQLLFKALNEDNSAYDPQIQQLNGQIEMTLNEIKKYK